MFATIDGKPSLFRTPLSLASLLGLILDPLVIIATLVVVLVVHDHTVRGPEIVLALIVFSLTFPGTARWRSPLRALVRDVVIGWLLLATVLIFLGWATGFIKSFDQAALRNWIMVTPLSLLCAHLLARQLMPRLLSSDAHRRRAVFAGGNELAAKLGRELHKQKQYFGIDLIGYFDDRQPSRLAGDVPGPLLGTIENLSEYVKSHRVDLIYITLPMASQPRILKLLDELHDTTASIYFVPDIFIPSSSAFWLIARPLVARPWLM